jgi:hypothetical protein
VQDFDADPRTHLPTVFSNQVMRHVDATGEALPSFNSQPSYSLWLLHPLRPEPGQRVFKTPGRLPRRPISFVNSSAAPSRVSPPSAPPPPDLSGGIGLPRHSARRRTRNTRSRCGMMASLLPMAGFTDFDLEVVQAGEVGDPPAGAWIESRGDSTLVWRLKPGPGARQSQLAPS